MAPWILSDDQWWMGRILTEAKKKGQRKSTDVSFDTEPKIL